MRMRSLDECRVAVRSRKVDLLGGNERYCVVELMRVARYCVYVSTTACFKFATFCLKSATWHISDFNPYGMAVVAKKRDMKESNNTKVVEIRRIQLFWVQTPQTCIHSKP